MVVPLYVQFCSRDIRHNLPGLRILLFAAVSSIPTFDDTYILKCVLGVFTSVYYYYWFLVLPSLFVCVFVIKSATNSLQRLCCSLRPVVLVQQLKEVNAKIVRLNMHLKLEIDIKVQANANPPSRFCSPLPHSPPQLSLTNNPTTLTRSNSNKIVLLFFSVLFSPHRQTSIAKNFPQLSPPTKFCTQRQNNFSFLNFLHQLSNFRGDFLYSL